LILKKALFYACGVAALSAAAAVCVVALAFALYAAVAPFVGPAWGGAIVAGTAALLIALGALVMLVAANPPKPKAAEQKDTVTRLIELGRDKPIIAAGALVAAGVVAMRNPKIATALVAAFLAKRPAPTKK
jgi:hypothetical protein